MAVVELEKLTIREVVPKKNGNFYVLKQDGALRLKDNVTFGGLGSTSSDGWRIATDTEKAKVHNMRTQIISILGIERISQIPGLINNPGARKQASDTAYELIGGMYGMEQKPESETELERKQRRERIAVRVKGYGDIANSVITHLAEEQLPRSHADLTMVNEIKNASDPVELLLLAHDNRYHRRVRFEAARKLQLMALAAALDQREQESGVEEKGKQLDIFLDEHVYSQARKRGETILAYLYSTHDPETFDATSVRVLHKTEADRQRLLLKPYEKITPVQRRTVQSNGQEIPVYVNTRQKDPVASVLKLLRKGHENPAVAVDDSLGLMAVLETENDLDNFRTHLVKGATEAGSMLQEEETQNTLHGEKHVPSSPGSSPDIRMYKSHMRINGMRFEFQGYTIFSYLDSLYRRDSGHYEYDVKRLFNSGVVSLLFPETVYGYNEEDMRESAIKKVRSEVESQY